MSVRRAVFLDRDGTIIEDIGYLAAAADVRLLPGAAAAIARLNAAGLAVVVVTNQSGIARGLLDEAAYAATARRLDDLLAAQGARLDAHYHCPHHPEFTGPCECRKPGPLLYRRAAEELGIDLSPASVRGAAGAPSAQEVEEGAPEEGSDLALASDEDLEEEAAVEGEEELALPADLEVED